MTGDLSESGGMTKSTLSVYKDRAGLLLKLPAS